MSSTEREPTSKIVQAFWRWRSSHLGRLVVESLRTQGRLYAVSIVAMIIVAAATAGTAWIMERVIDALANPSDFGRVVLVATSVAGLFLVKGAATYVQFVYLARAGNRIVAVNQERLYGKLLSHGVAFFREVESSQLLMRLVTGAQAARQLIDLLVTSFFRDSLTLIGLLIVMFIREPVLSSISIVLAPLVFIGLRLILKKIRTIMQAEMASVAEIMKVLQETSGGIEVIKVFGLEPKMSNRMNGAIKQVEARANAITKLQSITSPLVETIAGVAIAGVVVFSALNIGGTSPATPGQLMSFVTALLLAYEPAKRLSRMRVVIETQMVGVSMMFELLDRTEPLRESSDAVLARPGPGRIELKDVTFGYNDDTSVLNDLTLTFEAGKTTAIVGRSGAGKSTIFGLILRFFDPDKGSVSIDGQDVQRLTLSSLHRKISYVGQNAFLFSASIMENLRCHVPEATDDDVIEAAKTARLHDFVSSLPEGYETEVGENGVLLSGGQRQRIAIARALLGTSDILLLDEATSALDTETETMVKQAIHPLIESKTTVIIAHRLSTVIDADKICVIQDGQLVEEGRADELLAKKGAFKALFQSSSQAER